MITVLQKITRVGRVEQLKEILKEINDKVKSVITLECE